MKMINFLDYKEMQVIFGVLRDLFKYFNDQITHVLIIRLIYASYFKTIPFCNL